MKLAITGKGGVGKTTLASLLARAFAAEGQTVLAIDADPDGNLASALGIPPEQARTVVPITEMSDLIEERTGAKPGVVGGYFRLNPRVDDIPDRFSIVKGGVKLLVLGTVKTGGAGCICPESAILKALMSHLLVGRSEVVIMDMEAGIEHLGRATAQGVDAFIVVVEPGRRSLQTAESIRKLAEDIGINQCYVVGNKMRGDEERRFVRDNLKSFRVLGFLTYSPEFIDADFQGISVYDMAPSVVEETKAIKAELEAIVRGRRDGSR
jgi:CO dehydrogenase maturation factor